jgi:L-ascorbate metabolism protein UlaG (beta-lactamase superfamily)
MITVLVIIILLVAIVAVFMQQASFGSRPSGVRQEYIKLSPNFRAGSFQNLSPTPSFTEGATFTSVLKEFMFGRNERTKPTGVLPSQKADLKRLSREENVLVWFGHSSYFMQMDGKRMLVDPVMSGNASPLSFTTKSFPGSDVYTPGDLPDIDYLFLSHDHWDHLDYRTVKKLKPRVGKVICALGVGAHLERWGFDKTKIVEKDWYDDADLGDGFSVSFTPSRHFSGRGFKRNGTLWTSFVLKAPTMKLFLGGDSGYDAHFADVGKAYGPFDLAILECGQYNKGWKYIHMMPEEVVQAAKDLGAAKLLPVHWSKFKLSTHAWDEPIVRVTAAAKEQGMPVVTPMIGEVVQLNAEVQTGAWWEGLQ